MEKTELLACPSCRDQKDASTRWAYIADDGTTYSEKVNFCPKCGKSLTDKASRTPSPDNMKTALLPLEFVFGHGAFGVGSVSEDENAPIREIIVYRLPNPVLPAGTPLGDVGTYVEALENVLVRMRFENAESAHVFERSVSRVLDSFGETDNCTNAECPYHRGAPCPSSDGCGGFVPDNKPMTAEELREREKPVWCDIPDCEWIPEGGYYCLCNGGFIIAPSGQRFSVDECLKNGWVLLDRPPEKGE